MVRVWCKFDQICTLATQVINENLKMLAEGQKDRQAENSIPPKTVLCVCVCVAGIWGL